MKTCIAFSGPDLALSQTKEIKHLSKEQHQKANGKLKIFLFLIFSYTLLPNSIFYLVNSDTLTTSTCLFRKYTQAFAQKCSLFVALCFWLLWICYMSTCTVFKFWQLMQQNHTKKPWFCCVVCLFLSFSCIQQCLPN